MRICVVGGGLAGTLLAWRLACRGDAEVRLVTGIPGAADATRSSGGLVRGFEPDPDKAAEAADSLDELYRDPRVRDMAGYRQTGSIYLPSVQPPRCIIEGLEARLPGSVSVLDSRAAKRRFGFLDTPKDGVVIVERKAGYIDPDRLRYRVRALLPKLGVEIVPTAARPCAGGFQTEPADVVVLATGPWTEGLLAAAGFPTGGLRTKAIQYSVCEVEGRLPPPFVDEHSGLYGRPAGPGRMVVGLPTQRWDVDPVAPVNGAEVCQVHAAVRKTLPSLRLCAPARSVAAADAYATDGRLRLRAVEPGLFTFTGGSGGAAKTALAASAAAARRLLTAPNTRRESS